ncbi:MAG TPA: hypothetical protein VKR56_01150 [Candidatus Cybelea sp.]|nr:hypothetical protein [Candidatus Cybelea sp.]
MRISGFGRYAISLCVAAATLAGCGRPFDYAQGDNAGGSADFTPLAVQRDAALTIPHFVPPVVHSDRGQSFMRPDGKKSLLLYVGDWSTNDVYVYDVPSGKEVGVLTGNDEPYGMCVDSKGNVYVANFGSGELIEYAHGVAKPINTYDVGGELIGCSVDTKGDVSATGFDPGEVTVYAGGNPQDGTTYSDSSCEYEWTAGYDSKDDLIGVGEYSSIDVCALLAGSKTETTLTKSGITIDFPGGSSWDGKYIALGDQQAGGKNQSGVWPSTLSGTTITAATSEVVFEQACDGDYSDIVNPFFLGKGFVPVIPGSTHRAKYMIGPNLWCVDSGYPGTGLWHYPSGKFFKTPKLSLPPSEPYGAAISWGR